MGRQSVSRQAAVSYAFVFSASLLFHRRFSTDLGQYVDPFLLEAIDVVKLFFS